ncbi:Zn-dependent hydrolase [Alkalicoccobacillus porphyridii]|uniref:Zn-dependent hydrolase n=1 Tax=Alkalicoccobacillus porphyridii TaxID=2597270 RepID=A0A554A441_9BACI|nr:Zn-dependent hydrolase [Alkalicoccobacillus porphyridii]TSB48436.1 Zn-dependent hydrolase [Alkalicoccobacillus porphyridii]
MTNQERVWQRIEKLSAIGKTQDGGVTRYSYTDEEAAANELVKSFMEEAGLEAGYDSVGNLYGILKGEKDETILIGSHVDSVPNGGNFDGPLGVLGGIEVLQTLQEEGIKPKHTLKVMAFKDEEGSRFGLGMIGSRAVAGTLTQHQLQQQDSEGVSIHEAMTSMGYDPTAVSEAALTQVKAYIELHIEQGKILESAQVPAGVVSGIAGPVWLRMKLTGEAGHAGSTPMNQRRDTLVAASLIIAEIERIALQHPDLVATVGQIAVKPGGTNVIPGYSEWTLDLRHVDEAVRDQAEKQIRDATAQIANERDLELEIDEMQRISPAPCSEQIQQLIQTSLEEAGIKPITLPSGAGHDGMQFIGKWPMGMIFARSKDGISHNPKEWTTSDDVATAVNILDRTVRALDQT